MAWAQPGHRLVRMPGSGVPRRNRKYPEPTASAQPSGYSRRWTLVEHTHESRYPLNRSVTELRFHGQRTLFRRCVSAAGDCTEG